MKAQLGDIVVVVYDGYLENDEVFESSDTSGPLEFKVGCGDVMAGFEENIIGMAQGESKSFQLPPEKAHGLSNPELIHTMNRSALPNPDSLETGMILGMNVDREGQEHKIPAMITALDNDKVTLDFNHPLAGKSLTYKVTLQTIRKGEAQPPQ